MDEKSSTVNICDLKNKKQWLPNDDDVLRIIMDLVDLEIFLSTRVPKKKLTDVLNLVRASFGMEGSDWGKGLVSENCAITKIRARNDEYSQNNQFIVREF